MDVLHRILAACGGLLGTLWVLHRRARYRRAARPLTPRERLELAPWFESSLLDLVRVAPIERIDNPAFLRALGRLGIQPPLDLRTMWGMAFIDTIVLARGSEQRGPAVLFHEMVHIAQYRARGTTRFLRGYLLGWLHSGRDYWSIPDEIEAYTLTRRFSRGERFSVEREIRDRLDGAG